MARRYDHTKEELKALAIRAGCQLIQEKGFSKFSARAVAASIGYTVGTLYYEFGSLDEFILHINAAILDAWYEELEKGLAGQKKNQVQYLATAYLKFARKHYNCWLALFEHHMEDDAPVPEWYATKMARFFTLVEGALPPYASNKKAKHISRMLWAGVHGICILSLSGKLEVVGEDSAEQLINSLVKTTLDGMKVL